MDAFPLRIENLGGTASLGRLVAHARHRQRYEPTIGAAAAPRHSQHAAALVAPTRVHGLRAARASGPPPSSAPLWVTVVFGPFAIALTLTAVLIVARFCAMALKLL